MGVLSRVITALLALTPGIHADPAPTENDLLQRLEKSAYADSGFRTEWTYRREMVNAPAQPSATLQAEKQALEKQALERLNKSPDKALSPEAKSVVVEAQTKILETLNHLPPTYTTEGKVTLLMESPSRWYLETKCVPLNGTEPITLKWIANGNGLVAKISLVTDAKTGAVLAESVITSDQIACPLRDELAWLPGFWLAANRDALRHPSLSADHVLAMDFSAHDKLRAQINPKTFQITSMERFDATGRVVIMWGKQGADWSSHWSLIPSLPDSILATLKERKPLDKEDLQKLDYVIPSNGLVSLLIHGATVKVDQHDMRGKHLSDIRAPAGKKD